MTGLVESNAKTDSLGNAPAEQVMSFLRPSYWFSGHMHARFSATVDHNKDINIFKHESIRDDFKKLLPRTMNKHSTVVKKSAPKSVSTAITNTATQFLALDKPGPGNEFLEILEINGCANLKQNIQKQYMEKSPDGKFRLQYDEEWLAILRSSSETMDKSVQDITSANLDTGTARQGTNDMQWIRDNITANGFLAIPNNFEIVAPANDPLNLESVDEQPPEYPNPQTEKLCQLLGIRNKFSACESVEDEDSFVTFG
jgi:lariat debranching enzyme